MKQPLRLQVLKNKKIGSCVRNCLLRKISIVCLLEDLIPKQTAEQEWLQDSRLTDHGPLSGFREKVKNEEQPSGSSLMKQWIPVTENFQKLEKQ